MRWISGLVRFVGISLIVVGGGHALAALVGFCVVVTQRFQTSDQDEIRTFRQDMGSDIMLFTFACLVLVVGVVIRLAGRQDVKAS